MTAVPADKLAEAVERLALSRADESAWNMLANFLWPILLAVAFRILRGNIAAVEDAIQESLVRLFSYARFEDFKESPDAFRSYALVTCRNVSRSILSQLTSLPENLEDYETVPARPYSNPELSAIHSEMFARLVLSLDPDNRNLLDLLMQGYTISEVGERLGLTYGATAVRIHRFRASVYKMLKIN